MWYEQPLLLKALLSWHTDGLQASFLGTEDWRCAVLCCCCCCCGELGKSEGQG